jgi:hypothetical protein
MQDYTNGCRDVKDCQGQPTHIYRPQGGFPVAYCVACMPSFVKSRVSTLETTIGFEQSMEQMYAALAVQIADDSKKTRRTRKKKVEEPTDVVDESVEEATDVVEDVDVVLDVEQPEETPSE